MLVSGRVKNHRGLVVAHHASHCHTIAHVNNDRDCKQPRKRCSQLLLNLENGVFTATHQHDARGMDHRQLSAQLRPDGAASAGDEHCATVHERAYAARIGFDRRALQKVFDPDFAQLRRNVRARDHFMQRRYGPCFQTGTAGELENVANHRTRSRGHGNDHMTHTEGMGGLRQLRDVAHYRQVTHDQSAFAGFVVEKSDGAKSNTGLRQQLARSHLSSRTGAHDERGRQSSLDRSAFTTTSDEPTGDARQNHGRRCQ